MAGPKDGWAKLAKNLRAEIDADLIEAYRGMVSHPFDPGEHGRAAVKIVDHRGVESLKIVELVQWRDQPRQMPWIANGKHRVKCES